MVEQITLGFKDYSIIAYLVGLVIFFAATYQHLSKPTCYRLLFSAIIGIIWPLPAALLVVLAIEALLQKLREALKNG